MSEPKRYKRKYPDKSPVPDGWYYDSEKDQSVPTPEKPPKWAPHDGPYYDEPNPFPVPLQPYTPVAPSPFEWWYSPNHKEWVPVQPALKEGHRFANVEGNDIWDYPVASIIGMGPEGAARISSGKGGRSALSTGSGKGK